MNLSKFDSDSEVEEIERFENHGEEETDEEGILWGPLDLPNECLTFIFQFLSFDGFRNGHIYLVHSKFYESSCKNNYLFYFYYSNIYAHKREKYDLYRNYKDLLSKAIIQLNEKKWGVIEKTFKCTIEVKKGEGKDTISRIDLNNANERPNRTAVKLPIDAMVRINRFTKMMRIRYYEVHHLEKEREWGAYRNRGRREFEDVACRIKVNQTDDQLEICLKDSEVYECGLELWNLKNFRNLEEDMIIRLVEKVDFKGRCLEEKKEYFIGFSSKNSLKNYDEVLFMLLNSGGKYMGKFPKKKVEKTSKSGGGIFSMIFGGKKDPVEKKRDEVRNGLLLEKLGIQDTSRLIYLILSDPFRLRFKYLNSINVCFEEMNRFYHFKKFTTKEIVRKFPYIIVVYIPKSLKFPKNEFTKTLMIEDVDLVNLNESSINWEESVTTCSIKFGPWVLRWDEEGLIVPKRLKDEHKLLLEKCKQKRITTLCSNEQCYGLHGLRRISELIIKYNERFVYTDNPPETENEKESVDFVKDFLKIFYAVIPNID